VSNAEKFYRAFHAQAQPIVERLKADPASKLTPGDASTLSLAVGALKDVCAILADHEKQAKARRGRIQWVSADGNLFVAIVGRRLTARLAAVRKGGYWLKIRDDADLTVADLGTVTSIEAASRKVRAWRKAQRKGRAS
jgi:hypothetical protein